MASLSKCFIVLFRLSVMKMLILSAFGFGQSNWDIFPKLEEFSEFASVEYGNGLFVCVTGTKSIYTSDDGKEWTLRENPATKALYNITFTGDRFVAVGGAIVTSPDGIEWTEQTFPEDLFLCDVAYGNGIYVAVGYHGIIITSEDGITWTKQKECINWLNGVTFGMGMFVCCGDYKGDSSNTSAVYTSADGINWTKRHTGVQAVLWQVASNEDLFVITNVNLDTTAELFLYSSDGVTWLQDSGLEKHMHDIIYANNQFVAVGESGTIATSSNAVDWALQELPIEEWIVTIAYGNDRYVAFSINGKPMVSMVDESIVLQPEATASFTGNTSPDIDVHGSIIHINNLPSSYQGTAAISCFSAAGRRVFSRHITITGNAATLPIDHLPAGRYIISAAGRSSTISSMITTGGAAR
ncbi:MAG: hypothetical protein JW863_00335 [Chitinispirillaceae bacterium]|nr:hypothetical protein [Chitinispirillaceae bacterium]